MKLILSMAILLAISACGLLLSEQSDQHSPIEFNVATSTGITQGHLNLSADEQSGAEVISWFDIPYAQPPVGDLRWRAPRALIAPQQVIVERDDTACVQFASRYGGANGEGVVGSEDCLYLDIRAPKDFLTNSTR